METNENYTQYQDCTIENLLSVLKELFNLSFTKESVLQDICDDDVKKMEMIQNGISKHFGVHISIKDILNSPNVGGLLQTIKTIIENPKYPVSEKDARRNLLEQIANDKDLSALIGTLKKAEDQLSESLDKINNLSAPSEKIGYQTKTEWLNGVLNFVDPKVSKDNLREVIGKVDENYKGAFDNIGEAIRATNKWIDVICNALIWIVQIENDLYDISEETSAETLKMSRILSKDGENIEGLAEVAALEKNRRQRIQQKIKEFKADIEGKIDFLNSVNQRLKEQFEDYKNELNKEFNTLNESLKQQINDDILRISNEQKEALLNLRQNLQSDFLTLQGAINDSKLIVEKKQEKIDQTISAFMDKQNALFTEMKKQQNVSKVISLAAIVVAVASILCTIFI